MLELTEAKRTIEAQLKHARHFQLVHELKGNEKMAAVYGKDIEECEAGLSEANARLQEIHYNSKAV